MKNNYFCKFPFLFSLNSSYLYVNIYLCYTFCISRPTSYGFLATSKPHKNFINKPCIQYFRIFSLLFVNIIKAVFTCILLALVIAKLMNIESYYKRNGLQASTRVVVLLVSFTHLKEHLPVG